MSRHPVGFWTVWTAVAIDLLGFGIVIPLLPLYAERFGATPLQIGMLFASYSLAQFLMAPVMGKLSDRIGRKPVLLVTITGSALGSLVLGLAGTLPLLFLGRVIDGASGASLAVARATVADIADPAQRPRLMGLLGAAFGVGFVLGPAIGAVAALVGPRVPFLVAAVISTANLIAAAIRLPETRRIEAPSVGPGRGLPTSAYRLAIAGFAAVTAFSAFEATFALLGSDRLGLTDSAVALVFAAVGVVLVGTQGAIVGPVTRRWGESTTLRLALVLDAVGFLLLAWADGWARLGPGLVLLALGQGLLIPTLAAAMTGVVRSEKAGAALGVHQSAGGLARVVGPIIGGALFAVAIPIPYLAAAALAAAAIFVLPRSSPTPA